MLPDTLNLIDSALEWDKGTLNRLVKPPSRDVDVIATQPDGTVVRLEAKVIRPELASTARRRQLVALAATLDDSDVQRVLDFIASEMQGWAPLTRDEIERFRDEMAHLKSTLTSSNQ